MCLGVSICLTYTRAFLYVNMHSIYQDALFNSIQFNHEWDSMAVVCALDSVGPFRPRSPLSLCVPHLLPVENATHIGCVTGHVTVGERWSGRWGEPMFLGLFQLACIPPLAVAYPRETEKAERGRNHKWLFKGVLDLCLPSTPFALDTTTGLGLENGHIFVIGFANTGEATLEMVDFIFLMFLYKP